MPARAAGADAGGHGDLDRFPAPPARRRPHPAPHARLRPADGGGPGLLHWPPASRSTPCRSTSPARSAPTPQAPGWRSGRSPSRRSSCGRSPAAWPTPAAGGRSLSAARCCSRSSCCHRIRRTRCRPWSALRLVLGVAEAAFFVASFAALADLAPPDRIGEALSYNSLGLYLGLALGPPLGEVVVRTAGFDGRLVRRRGAGRAGRRCRGGRRRDPGRGDRNRPTGPAGALAGRSHPASASWPRSSPWAVCSRSPPCTRTRSGSRPRASRFWCTAGSWSSAESCSPRCQTGCRRCDWAPRRWPRWRPA